MHHAANLSLLYPHLQMLDRPAAAAADGFTGAEILFPYDLDPSAWRAALDAAGLVAVLINTPPGERGERGLAAVCGAQERFRRDFEQALHTAAVLGVSSVHTMAGLVPAEQIAPALATLTANLRWAAPRAAQRGVTLTLEGLNREDFPGYCYATPAAVCEVLAAVDEPNVRLQFDLYHTAKEGLDPRVEIKAARPWIHHVQIAGPPHRHEPTAAEEAMFDALAWLATDGYDGWLGFEYHPSGDTSAGLAWRALLAR